MSRRSWKQWFLQQFGLIKQAKKPHRAPRRMAFETLDQRLTPAVNAFFGGGVLTIRGDHLNNTIDVSRDAAGHLLVNGGAVSIKGATSTVTNTKLITVFGLSGNDTISLNETNGALPRANLYGGSGNDTLTGGAGNDQLFGEAGDDTVLGKGGVDLLFGGAGNDTLTGGAGNDQVFGQAGNDRMIWNPGDGSDLNEGGAGNDTSEQNGGNVGETFTATANGNRVRFDRTDPAPFFVDIGTTENLVVNMNGGDDSFTGSNGLATLIKLTVDGGAGNDTIRGGDGADMLLGGDGNDFIDGNGGSDKAFLGAGDDTFQWDPGDGSDIVDGQEGNDAMLFNGSNLNEVFEASATGQRVRFTRDLGNIVMDLNHLEAIDLNALGGADKVTINDLSGTDVVAANLDLGPPDDGAADAVIVNGTRGNDRIDVLIVPLQVVGLHTAATMTNFAGATDSLTINAGAGDDEVVASTVPAGAVKLTENGESGNDILVGSRGDDTLFGGDGDDTLLGFRGNDVLNGGTGNDSFEWDPGDGSDTIEGQEGQDTLLFIGANVDEQIDISASGNRVRLARDVNNINMDIDGVERIDFSARGGADTITVNDLSATDVSALNLDLDSADGNGTGDGANDSVIINGTAGDDAIQIASFDNGTRIAIGGLFPFINITGAEGPSGFPGSAGPDGGDRLTVTTLGGDDAVDDSGLAANLINLTQIGGTGSDLLIGSAGDDTFVWNPGDGSDTLEGGEGADTMVFNGNAANE